MSQELEIFKIFKNMSKNIDHLDPQLSLAMVCRNGQESFATVEPQREVGGGIARNAVQ